MDNPTFVNSTLKVVAKEEFDISKELASENSEKTIEELLQEQNDEKKE